MFLVTIINSNSNKLYFLGSDDLEKKKQMLKVVPCLTFVIIPLVITRFLRKFSKNNCNVNLWGYEISYISG